VHVTIDYTPAVKQRAGIGRYTRELVRALVKADPPYRLTLFVAGKPRAKSSELPPGVRLCTTPLSARHMTILWQRLRFPLPADWVARPTNLWHATDFTLPPLRRAQAVLTIHDLSFLRVPECADPGLQAYLSETVPRSVSRADLILADSENTKQDIVELLDVSPDRIRVVYAGVGEQFAPVEHEGQRQVVARRYGLNLPFILSVGTLEPRKNYPRLIAAYARLRAETDLPHKLVIVGSRGWLYQAIFAQVQRSNLLRDVIFPGFVADTDLPTVYSMADAFVFPSLYEGFGIPPLEAMACGTPVVCANNSSLPEAVGDAALLFNAEDEQALANTMVRILTDQALRERLRQRGFIRARKFTWQKAAQQLLSAYDEVNNQTSPG